MNSIVAWWGYAAAAIAGALVMLGVETLRRNRDRREADAVQANIASIKRERDAIVVKLRTVEQEATELRAGIAAADSKRFSDAERQLDASHVQFEEAASGSMREVLAATEATERSLLRVRKWMVQQRGRSKNEPEQLEQGEVSELRETLRSKEEDFAVVLDRLHTFETDWFREHTAVLDARQRIQELEARLSGLGDTAAAAVSLRAGTGESASQAAATVVAADDRRNKRNQRRP